TAVAPLLLERILDLAGRRLLTRDQHLAKPVPRLVPVGTDVYSLRSLGATRELHCHGLSSGRLSAGLRTNARLDLMLITAAPVRAQSRGTSRVDVPLLGLAATEPAAIQGIVQMHQTATVATD